jgi:hypothetical protein
MPMDSESRPLDIGPPNSLEDAQRREEAALDLMSRTIADYSRLLDDYENLITEHNLLGLELDEAQHDPLTGFWLNGPGLSELNEVISLVENNRAGLGDPNGPSAILGIGLDVEGLHYTNNWYGQKGGNTRLIQASRELRDAAEVLKDSVRTQYRRQGQNEQPDESDRRSLSGDRRQGKTPPTDVLIRTGGDEFMAAMAVHLTAENTEEKTVRAVLGRLSARKNQNVPGLRILYHVGFLEPGQNAEDFYLAIDPKARMNRLTRLARPIFKVVRLGMGQYKPPIESTGEL